MEKAPENGKESPHSAHANGMNIKFLSGMPHRHLWTVHTWTLNGVNMLCIYRWSGAFALMPTAGVSKMFVPCVN